MRFKYFIRFKNKNIFCTRYIRARSYKQAITKLIDQYNVNDITHIEFKGDPIPTDKTNTIAEVKKKNEAKERKKLGAIKYYQLTDKYVNSK